MSRAQTIVEFADSLAISPDSVRRLIQSGKLQAVKVGIGGKRQALRILPEHREAFLRESSVSPEPGQSPESEPSPKRRQQRDRDFVEYYK